MKPSDKCNTEINISNRIILGQKIAPNSAILFIGQSSEFSNQQENTSPSGARVAMEQHRAGQLQAGALSQYQNLGLGDGNRNQEQLSIANDFEQSGNSYPADGGGPVGLRALCSACARLYADQPNPLQVTARVKYWLGGPDPLDYISMYWNAGRPDLNVPPHWHYVSFGLSDLHGDGRVHAPPDKVLLAAQGGPGEMEIHSGLGLEMTFRLRAEPGTAPPTWPAALLQSLARYVFRTGNRLCAGDHVSWHEALDGSRCGRLRHMLVAPDPQLGALDTPLGRVQFVQIVGATGRELRAAQRGTGAGVLQLMAADPGCGGAWHVTDMRRARSAAGVLRPRVACPPGPPEPPSDLAGVSTVCRWTEWNVQKQGADSPSPRDAGLAPTLKEQIRSALQRGLSEMGLQPHPETSHAPPVRAQVKDEACTKMSTDSLKLEKCTDLSTDSLKMIFAGTQRDVAMSTDSFEMSKIEDALLEEVLRHEIPQIKEEGDECVVKSESLPGDRCQRRDCAVTLTDDGCRCANGAVGATADDSAAAADGSGCQGYTDPAHQDLSRFNETGHSQEGVPYSSWLGAEGAGSIVLPGVHLIFNAEGGSLLPLALRGRVLHGRHFTWRCAGGVQALTLLGRGVAGALTSPGRPLAATRHGWLQVLLTEELARDMAAKMDALSWVADTASDAEEDRGDPHACAPAPPALPVSYEWPQHGIKITILDNDSLVQ